MKRILTTLLIGAIASYGATFNVNTTPELRTAFSTAATNGEDDTIILADGTYKTTDDAEGTFIYYEQNWNALVLKGSLHTVLDGNSSEQILKSSSGTLTLENLSFQNGNSLSNGGAVSQTNSKLYVNNCNFKNNYAYKSGGALYTTNGFEIKSSMFKDNESSGGTGGWENGGAIFFDGYGILQNSHFINNISKGSSSRPGGMSIYADFDSSLRIENSYFESNNTNEYSPHVSILRGHLNIHNTIFNKSNSNIGLYGNSTAKIYNSIFKNIFNYNFIADDEGKINIYNSYVDTSLKYGGFIMYNENLLFNEINLGFLGEANGDYTLTSSSDLIDAGTTTIDGITLPDTDLNGNIRVVGASIDIGPYEFTTSKPTLGNFTYTGTAKELNELTFSIVYTFDGSRTLDNIAYDYTNDGSWSALNTHTFNTAGTYTVNVKVTDSQGEFSTTSLDVTISELPFADMTDEQKLIKAIDPTYYTEIISIIEQQKDSDATTVLTNGITQGKQYVQDNLSEFDLVNEVQLTVTASDVTDLPTGWNLISTKAEITDLTVFNSATIIWIWNQSASSWSAWSSNATTSTTITNNTSISTITTIPTNSGIWVLIK